MSRVYRWRQTVEYTVTMLDVGEVTPEFDEPMTAEQADASAEDWMKSAMPIEYYPEDFVTVDEGPVEYLGMVRSLDGEGKP